MWQRAQKRWSALVAAPRSRIALQMRAHLGEDHWQAFVRHAENKWKTQFLRAFEPSTHVLACAGPIEGGPCPYQFSIYTHSIAAESQLQYLHLDHTHDLSNVCAVWRQAVPQFPQSWHEDIDGDRLCHMLFRMRATERGEPSRLHFRCGEAHGGLYPGRRFCHASSAHSITIDAIILRSVSTHSCCGCPAETRAWHSM